MNQVEVLVAHRERATLRVGDVFLKIDADEGRLDVEVQAMALAPVPTPEVLWRKPHVQCGTHARPRCPMPRSRSARADAAFGPGR